MATLPVLATLLQSEISTVQRAAAECMAVLANGDQPEKNAISATGALPVLARLSNSQEPDVKQQALAALEMLTSVSKIGALVQLACLWGLTLLLLKRHD